MLPAPSPRTSALLASVLTAGVVTATLVAATPAAHGAVSPSSSTSRPGPALQRASSDPTLEYRDAAWAAEHARPTDPAPPPVPHRPTDPGDPYGDSYGSGITPTKLCESTFCLTWVTAGSDAPPAADSDGDRVPDQVELTQATVAHVLDTYADAGLRAPLPDAGGAQQGGTTATDIYLADLGDDGVYGYCVPEFAGSDKRAPGYCVIDNDFSADQYGADPVDSLQVTLAHELFHLVQFAYDAQEDSWLLESMATWAEELLYTGANDNRQYLSAGPLGRPALPLDVPDEVAKALHSYGTWILWQYMADRYHLAPLTLADRVLTRAAADPGAVNLDSLKATRAVVESLDSHGWASFFTNFALANRRPGVTYPEGSAYPAAPVTGVRTLTKKRSSTGKIRTRLDHLTAVHQELRPGSGTKGKWRVRIAVDGPNRSTGIRTAVVVTLKSGVQQVSELVTNAKGNGSKAYTFDRTKVARVVLTLVNAGTRFNCTYSGSGYSCGGSSLDDDRIVAWTAKAVKG